MFAGCSSPILVNVLCFSIVLSEGMMHNAFLDCMVYAWFVIWHVHACVCPRLSNLVLLGFSRFASCFLVFCVFLGRPNLWSLPQGPKGMEYTLRRCLQYCSNVVLQYIFFVFEPGKAPNACGSTHAGSLLFFGCLDRVFFYLWITKHGLGPFNALDCFLEHPTRVLKNWLNNFLAGPESKAPLRKKVHMMWRSFPCILHCCNRLRHEHLEFL